MIEEAEEEGMTPHFQGINFTQPKGLVGRMEKSWFCRLKKKKHDLKKAERVGGKYREK